MLILNGMHNAMSMIQKTEACGEEASQLLENNSSFQGASTLASAVEGRLMIASFE